MGTDLYSVRYYSGGKPVEEVFTCPFKAAAIYMCALSIPESSGRLITQALFDPEQGYHVAHQPFEPHHPAMIVHMGTLPKDTNIPTCRVAYP